MALTYQEHLTQGSYQVSSFSGGGDFSKGMDMWRIRTESCQITVKFDIIL